jgi:hypothetical protein
MSGIKSPRGVDLVQGEVYVLEASSAHATIAANTPSAAAFNHRGERSRLIFMLDVTAAANLVGDTLDVMIDVIAPDTATWLNAIHFPQVLGNGGAKKYFAVLDPSNPGAVTFDVTADAAVGVVRPALFGSSVQGRYTIAGGGAQSFTFSISLYATGGMY